MVVLECGRGYRRIRNLETYRLSSFELDDDHIALGTSGGSRQLYRSVSDAVMRSKVLQDPVREDTSLQ